MTVLPQNSWENELLSGRAVKLVEDKPGDPLTTNAQKIIPKCQGLKSPFYYLTDSVGQEFRLSGAGWFVSVPQCLMQQGAFLSFMKTNRGTGLKNNDGKKI